ncbi:MAG: lysoplasmalogenase [Anaerolineales bacterium]|nr:lysoplasmalogenase [Anaerolineales bacterium]
MTFFLSFAAVFAVLDWFAVATNQRRLEYVAKPATMLGLILWFATLLPAVPTAASTWFLLGMGLFLTGDFFFMLPPVNFIKGLFVFLLGHIAYIVALNLPQPILHPLSLVFLAVIGASTLFLISRIPRTLHAHKQGELIGPVIAYTVVLGLTFFSTLSTFLRVAWPAHAAVLAAIGGGLCVLADSMLAWNGYVKPIPNGRLLTTITYHLSQFFLATSFLLFLDLIAL